MFSLRPSCARCFPVMILAAGIGMAQPAQAAPSTPPSASDITAVLHQMVNLFPTVSGQSFRHLERAFQQTLDLLSNQQQGGGNANSALAKRSTSQGNQQTKARTATARTATSAAKKHTNSTGAQSQARKTGSVQASSNRAATPAAARHQTAQRRSGTAAHSRTSSAAARRK